MERQPQWPAKCRLPEKLPEQQKRRRLGESISAEQAREACKDWSPDQIKFCIQDVMTTRNLDLANAGGY